MREILLTYSYEGTNYYGSQWQPNFPSVEGELTKALERVCTHPVRFTSSGRTDRGVHALAQVGNFSTTSPIALEALPRVINQYLPDDIAVARAQEVRPGFHARYHVSHKRYRYLLYNEKVRHALGHNRVYCLERTIDPALLPPAFEGICGARDFRAFMGRYATVRDTIRDLYSVNMHCEGSLVILDFTGKSFLKNMIRFLVGTLVEIGRGVRDPEDLRRAVVTGKKEYVGAMAPACGLYLADVVVPEEWILKP